MRRLRVHEQFIDRQAFIFRKRPKIDPQFYDRQQIERFFRAHRMRVGQNAIRPADLVQERVRSFLNQNLPRVVFLFDDRFNDFSQPRDDLIFFFAKRGLV